jgi:hypothetical protein
MPQKLAWLEQAHRLVRQLEASRSAKRDGDATSDPSPGGNSIQ